MDGEEFSRQLSEVFAAMQGTDCRHAVHDAAVVLESITRGKEESTDRQNAIIAAVRFLLDAGREDEACYILATAMLALLDENYRATHGGSKVIK